MLARANGRTDERTDGRTGEGVPRGPRGPKNATSGQGKKNYLTLLLDYNEDRTLQTPSNNKDDVRSSDQTLNFDTAVESLQGESAKVQINTLSPYIDEEQDEGEDEEEDEEEEVEEETDENADGGGEGRTR